MTNREKMRRAIVLIDMAIELMEEVEMDMHNEKVVIESIKKKANGIDVVCKVK